MHRFAAATLVMGATLAPCCAQAQSGNGGPTFYGVLDIYLQSAWGDSTVHRVQSGGIGGSRLGLRGSEDLGDGLRAFYTLEAGVDLDDGRSSQGGTLFGRQVFVGLGSPRFGEVSLGRQYSSIFVASNVFSAFGNSGAGPNTSVIGGFAGGYEPVRGASATGVPPAAGATGNGGPARVSNSVRYESPSYRGLRIGALYGAGEVANATGDQRLIDLFVRYTVGTVDLLASRVTDKATGTVGTNATNATTTTVVGKVAIGASRLYGGFINVDDGRGANDDGRGYWVGGDYRFNAHHLVRAQYVANDPRRGSDNRSQAFGAGYQYDISKRTSLYSSLTRFANQANAGPAGSGRWNGAIPTGLTSASKNDLTELVGGIRHTF